MWLPATYGVGVVIVGFIEKKKKNGADKYSNEIVKT